MTIGLITSVANILPNKNYYFYCTESYDAINFNLSFAITYADGTIQYVLPNATKVSTSKDQEITKAALTLYIPSGTSVNFTNVKVMIVQSDTIDNEYEKYGASPSLDFPSEIQTVKDSANITICNKNLFRLSENETKNGITFTKNEDGSFDLVGTATKNADFFIILSNNEAGLKSGKTYTLSCNQKLSSNYYCNVEQYNDTTWISTQLTLTNGNLITDKIILDGTKVRFLFRVISGTTANLTNVKIQLEEGDVETEYVKPQKQSYAIDVQEEMFDGDYIDVEKQKEVHHWQKVFFDGTENWAISTDEKTFYVNDVVDSTDYSKVYCNMCLSASSYSELTGGKDRIAVRSSGKSISVSKRENMTLEDFKTLLSSTNMVIFCRMGESTELDLTDSQKSQLEEISGAKTYKNITNIYSNDNSGPIFNVNYKKDLETLFNNINSVLVN